MTAQKVEEALAEYFDRASEPIDDDVVRWVLARELLGRVGPHDRQELDDELATRMGALGRSDEEGVVARWTGRRRRTAGIAKEADARSSEHTTS